MATDRGIVANKNNNECTPEPVAASLLSAPINKLMCPVWSDYDIVLSYCTERRRQSDDSDKAPRLGGLFCVSDPRHGGCLRPLASMVANL